MAKWTNPAKRDLAAQLEFIAQDNPDIAAKIAATIKQAVNTLDDFPNLGREGMLPGTRELVIPRLPYVCVYRVRQGRVEILRFLHGKIKWPPE